jgi:hypothetical protein
LTELEEEVLAKRLLDADKRGFSIRPEFLRGMAQILLRERTGDPVATIGVTWAYKLLNGIQHYVLGIIEGLYTSVQSRRIQRS